MIERAIARRYAQALIKLAPDAAGLDVFLEQIEEFHGLCVQQARLLDFLKDRYADLGARLRVIDELAAKGKWDPLVRNFLKLLIKKGRITLIDEVVLAYRHFVYERTNRQEAHVISARALNNQMYAGIQQALADISGREIILRREVRPEVMGGIAIRMGEEIFDGTIKSHLDRLSENLRRTVL